MIKYSSIQGFANNIKQTSSSKPVKIYLCNSSKHVECGSQDKMFAIQVAVVDQLNHTINP